MKHNIELRDLISKNQIEELLETFSTMTGLAVVAIDKKNVFSKEINFTDFYKKYINNDESLQNYLQKNFNDKETVSEKIYFITNNNSGLVDFSVPIMLENEQIGSIICGQVFLEEPDPKKLKETAKSLNVDEKEFLKNAKKIKIVPKEKLEAAANMLYVLAKTLSNLALNNYKLKQNNKKQMLTRLVIESINSTFDVDKILNIICTSVVKLFDAERVAILEFKKDELKVLKQYKTNNNVGNLKDNLDAETYKKMVVFVKNYLINNIREPVAWFDRSIMDNMPDFIRNICIKDNIYSIVSANIYYDENSCIELLLETHNQDKIWTDEDKSFLILLTKQISIAFKQAKMYNEQIQMRLRESSILNNFPHAAWLKEINGKYLAVNNAFLDAVSIESQEQVLNKQDIDLFDYDTYQENKDEDLYVIVTKKPLSKEKESLHDGQKKIFQTYKSPVFNSDGEVWAIAGFTRDITNDKELERIKSEFVSIVSHELRTPLTSIIGSLDLISSKVLGELPEKIDSLVGVAQNNSHRLLKLINDILDIEKMEAEKMIFNMTNVDFQKTVDETIENLEEYATIFDTKIEKVEIVDNVFVKADKDRLIQVMTNIISNAIKFSNYGNNIEIRSCIKNNDVYLKVTNYGNEIPIQLKEHLFKKFYQINSSDTRKKGGTGLGLNIAKSMIEKMDGNINFVSKDKITTFYIKMPIQKA